MRRVRPIVIAGWFSATTVFAERINQEGRILGPLPVVTNFTKEEKAVLLGLKKYGAMVADNGNFFSISVTPDDRWPQGCFDNLTSVSITNFEVIQTTGPNEGPRSPGAPTASAGPDRSLLPGYPLPLQGVVNFTGAPPVIQWKLYLGPGPVAFGNANQTNTTATFTVPGVYTLMLSADDAVLSVAFDALVVTVSTSLSLGVARTATDLSLTRLRISAEAVARQAGPFQWSSQFRYEIIPPPRFVRPIKPRPVLARRRGSPFLRFHTAICPKRAERVSGWPLDFWVMLFRNSILTWSPSKWQVTVSWCGVS